MLNDPFLELHGSFMNSISVTLRLFIIIDYSIFLKEKKFFGSQFIDVSGHYLASSKAGHHDRGETAHGVAAGIREIEGGGRRYSPPVTHTSDQDLSPYVTFKCKLISGPGVSGYQTSMI